MKSRTIPAAACIGLLAFATVSPSQNRSIEQAMGTEGAATEVYKQTVDSAGNDVSLNAYVFYPDEHQPTDQRAVAVFFFGGGWNGGSPKQFSEQCKHLASRGMVAIAVDYRVKSRQNTKAKECVADGKSAIRWVRQNATRLGIDPDRVLAGGGSAGGHVAACTGTVSGFDEPTEDQSVSSRPNAMALFNPAVVLANFEGAKKFDSKRAAALPERMGTDPQNLSPIHHIDEQSPPTVIFHGTKDTTVPFWTVEAFTKAMKSSGRPCTLHGYEGEGHGFFNFGRGKKANFAKTMKQLDEFLEDLHYFDA